MGSATSEFRDLEGGLQPDAGLGCVVIRSLVRPRADVADLTCQTRCNEYQMRFIAYQYACRCTADSNGQTLRAPTLHLGTEQGESSSAFPYWRWFPGAAAGHLVCGFLYLNHP